MKTDLARYTETFFDAGKAKFEAGKHYPLDDETQRHINAGIAQLITVDLSVEKAQKLAEKARLAADRAASAAAEAEALAEAARLAQQLAADALAALNVANDVQTSAPLADQGATGGEGGAPEKLGGESSVAGPVGAEQ